VGIVQHCTVNYFFGGGFDFVTGGWGLGGARGYVALGWGGMVEGFGFRTGRDEVI